MAKDYIMTIRFSADDDRDAGQFGFIIKKAIDSSVPREFFAGRYYETNAPVEAMITRGVVARS